MVRFSWTFFYLVLTSIPFQARLYLSRLVVSFSFPSALSLSVMLLPHIRVASIYLTLCALLPPDPATPLIIYHTPFL